ncbi:GGDEF domain-containing protein [Nitrosomonas sp.]|uniref:sensor domain-containing diguanylate cyclase n=1 Tax=Nitrosomonas sp. TaxID=42353 RepID=UPI0025D1F3D2|nr:GGDEF domain-containing protein [Nitrosomonas sp.]
MIDDVLRRRLNFCATLPSLPAVAVKIIELANDPDADIGAVCQYISMDPVLSAKLLRTANTPLYKSRRIATNIRQAISILGTHTVIVIALSFSLSNSLIKSPLSSQGSAFNSNIFWRRSIATALASRAFGEKLELNFLDDLFLAGLIQEIGILAFWVIMPEEYGQVFASTTDHDTLLKNEREAFGAGHDELGYALLKKWHLPDYIALSCINSHAQPEPKNLGPTLQACLAVSRYMADYFLYPHDADKIVALNQAAQNWLEFDTEVLIDVIKIMEVGLSAVEDLFEMTLHDSSEVNGILAEAKELLMIHSLSRMRDLEDKSQRDGLTGAYNRTYFDDTLRREFNLATQYNLPLTVAIIDLDHFKQVNDTYGHIAGDSLLAAVVKTVFDQIRQDDTLSRYGGEEFALILPGTALSAARNLIARLKDSIAAISYKFDSSSIIQITASIGVVSYHENAAHFHDAKDLIKAADSALYAAKHAGRNRIIEWSPG